MHRVTNEGDNIKKTETEEWKHLQDSRNHQIQQSTKVSYFVSHFFYIRLIVYFIVQVLLLHEAEYSLIYTQYKKG